MAGFVGIQPFSLERTTGVEPASKAWEAFVLPMNYIRSIACKVCFADNKRTL